MDTSSQTAAAAKPQILVLADDLTGALESGAAFAQRGIDSRVTLLKTDSSGNQVLVVDTETRHASEPDAMTRIAELATSEKARLIYKKTDSTLRGNIRAELHALSLLAPVLYVPAYPQLGRTLINGCLHVYGVPVEQTPFAADPLHPVRNGNIAALLAGTSNINVCHASTEEAIETAAQEWIRAGGIAAGPSSLLHAAARVLAPECSDVKFPRVQRALVVSASQHERSQHQLSAASGALKSWRWSVFQAPCEHEGECLIFAAQFGERAKRAFESEEFDAIIVFGGDTAFSLLRAMNIDVVEPIGEVLPGIPVSLLPNRQIFITKAGGFGDPDLLFQLHEALSYEPR
ncbi:MAG: four-carbon acid sugar kinase family protein [Bryobacteraceae bacterium]